MPIERRPRGGLLSRLATITRFYSPSFKLISGLIVREAHGLFKGAFRQLRSRQPDEQPIKLGKNYRFHFNLRRILSCRNV